MTYAIRIQTAQSAESVNLQNDSIKKQVRYEAEKDATQNTNKLLWFGTGLGCCITTSTCAIVGGTIGGIINPPPNAEDDVGDIFLYDTSEIGIRSCLYDNGCIEEGCLSGSLFGCLIPLIGVYNYKINPSPEKLIGKSPEYIKLYTEAFKKKKQSIRRNMAIAGFSTGCLSVGVFFFISEYTYIP